MTNQTSSCRDITFLWIDPCPNERLRKAQEQLRMSALALGLNIHPFRSGPEMVKFREVLQFARDQCRGHSFVWCNSDVILKKNPFDVDDDEKIHGFHRTEIPSGEICGGVDMYLIPCKIWDTLLKHTMPDLWCGATHIDWWLTRAGVLNECYVAHTGFIDHPSHTTSAASKSRRNPYYRRNINEYNKWARRYGAAPIEYRIALPFVGESFSPGTDFLRYIRGKLRQN